LCGRIDTEDAHFLGIECQLLEGEDEFAVVGMAFDVGIELSREKNCPRSCSFELGHIDALVASRERLVEGGRHVAHLEQEGRNHRAIGRSWAKPLRAPA